MNQFFVVTKRHQQDIFTNKTSLKGRPCHSVSSKSRFSTDSEMTGVFEPTPLGIGEDSKMNGFLKECGFQAGKLFDPVPR
jgi:hypothetical protein